MNRIHSNRTLTLLTRAAGMLVAFMLLAIHGAASAGPVLDSTFGNQGVTRVGTPSGYEDTPTALAMTSDGGLVVGGWSTGRRTSAFITRFTSAGAVDTTFGDSGTTLLAPPPSYAWMTPAMIETTPEGGFLVTSFLYNAFMLTRFTAAGRPDASFGSGGSVLVVDQDFFKGSQEIAPIRTDILFNGNLLVVTDASANGNFAMRFRRFLPNGSVDQTFGTNGVHLLTGLPQNFEFTSTRLAVAEPVTRGEGFTIVATATIPGGTYLVVRTTWLGELDKAMRTVGYSSGYDIGNPTDVPTVLARNDGWYTLFGYNPSTPNQDPLWKVGLGGFPHGTRQTLPSAGGGYRAVFAQSTPVADTFAAQSDANGSVRITRLDSDGVPRPSFGTGGRVTVPVAGYVAVNPIGIHVDGLGRPVVAATGVGRFTNVPSVSRGKDVVLVSVTDGGAPRSDFGRGGGTAVWNNPAFSNDRVDTLLVDAQGRVDIAGFSDSSGTFDYLLARLNADGALDPAFATDGRLTPGILARFVGTARAALQPNGAIIVASGDSLGSVGTIRSATIFRASTNGAFDGNFRPAILPAGGNGTVGLAVRPDGRVLYLANDFAPTPGGTSSIVLQQFLPDGSVDTAFGTNGRATFPSASFDNTFLGDLVLQADGSAVFAVFSGSRVRIYKANADGSIPSANSFTQTSVTLPEISYNPANARLLALPDGTFLTIAAAYGNDFSSPVPRYLQMVRFAASGNASGQLRVPMSPSDIAIGAAALPDGSVMIARTMAPSVATLARLLPDGQFDAGFGGADGTPIGFTSVSALAVDASGRLVVGGQDATGALVARYRLDATATSVVAVEYFNVNLRHYFVTANPAEQRSIETGGAGPGWQRTGNDFRLWVAEAGVPVGAVPVCRFYGTPGRGPNSHFYTANPAECASVKRDPGWTYEGIAFFVLPPVNDQCPASSAVYRAYNNGFASNDSNHRYSTQRALLQAMTSQGWSVEGVAFCGAAN